jgi:small subunit ribosomal protein S3
MAVGETSGGAAVPRRVVSSSAAARRKPEGTGPDTETPIEAEPLVKEADPELERLLAEEEEIERRTLTPHETPKFHPGDSD